MPAAARSNLKLNRRNRSRLGIATAVSLVAAACFHPLFAAPVAPLGSLSPADALKAFETEPGSTVTYLVDRSVLAPLLGKPSEEVLADFIENIPKPEAKSDISTISYVWRSSGLTFWDKHVTGKLIEHTTRSLQRTMTRLEPEGFFKTYKEVEIPDITTPFQLTVRAAHAVGVW